MKKFFTVIGIVFLLLVLGIVILQIKPVDAYLTDLILENEKENKNYIIHSDNPGAQYSIDDPALPFLYVENRALYMSYKGKAIDITPSGINVSYYNNKEDINESLRAKKNCKVSKDGRYVVYVLEFNGMPYLYYCDFKHMTVGFISDKVNSFELVSIPDVKGPCVLYATGYESSNRLMLFYDSDSHFLKKDVKADYIENQNKAVILDYRHMLYEYDFTTLSASVIDHKVTDVYFSGENYNYNDISADFSVYYAKQDGDYLYRLGESQKLNDSYKSLIPKKVYAASSGYYGYDGVNLYYYDGENKSNVGQEIGKINNIIDYNKENEFFTVATNESVYVILKNKTVKLFDLSYHYRYCADAVAEHLCMYTNDYENFYFGLLTSDSLVINPRNTYSWLNKVSNLLYGLYYVNINDVQSGKEIIKMNVPESRKIPDIRSFASTNGIRLLYTAYYNDGTIKSLSLMDDNANILSHDVLETADKGISKNALTVFFASDGVYILHETKKVKMFYKFNDDATALMAEASAYVGDTENDFIVATSFGEMIIFMIES